MFIYIQERERREDFFHSSIFETIYLIIVLLSSSPSPLPRLDRNLIFCANELNCAHGFFVLYYIFVLVLIKSNNQLRLGEVEYLTPLG